MTKKSGASRAFSLVELLLVMLIIAVLTGLASLGGVSNTTVDAFTEATRIEESVRSLRSAWLACWSETYYQNLRVPTTKTTYSPSESGGTIADTVIAHLSAYCDRPIEDDIKRYGGIAVGQHTNGGVYIGFANVTGKIADADVRAAVERALAKSELDLRDGSFARYRSGGEVLIRIR